MQRNDWSCDNGDMLWSSREVEWIPFVSVWQRPGECPLLVENVLLFIPFGIIEEGGRRKPTASL